MDGSRFGYQIAAVGESGLSDVEMYREAVIDATLLHRLGYDAAWIVEHRHQTIRLFAEEVIPRVRVAASDSVAAG